DADHLLRRGHLDIQMSADGLAQDLDVAILNVPAIAAKMNGDALGSGKLADCRSCDGIGLVGLSCLADGGDVIDVDCKPHEVKVNRCAPHLCARGGEMSVPVIVRSRGGFRNEVEAGAHRFVLDEPASAGGTDEGPTPYDALAAALGGCTSMTLHFYARREKYPL